MNINTNTLRRPGFMLAAVTVAVASLFPALTQLVNADQVATRSIQMSDATPSHANTTYKVSFTPVTTGAKSLVIDFCSNSSIIGGACTSPTGFDARTSLAFTGGTGTSTGWNVDTTSGFVSTGGIKSRVAVVNAGGSNALGTSAVDFELTGITNQSTTGTFWARIYTYTDTGYGSSGTAYTDAQNLGTYADYGGFAMSTVSLINISATVMETLTFCVNKSQPGNGCTSLTTPVNLTLGHGTPKVLDSSVVDTDDAYFQISTNALTGAVVAMKTHNTCSGLSRNGGTDLCPIPGIGTHAVIPAATADFGMQLASVAGGTGTVAATTDYDATTNPTHYGMTTGVTSTYGSPIANTAGTATSSVNAHMTFGAQASVTTPAGVYTAAESLIATGTF